MEMSGERIVSALSALAQHLDYAGGPEVELVVCGGSALQVLGLVDRVTRDVDVLALARTGCNGDVELLPRQDLPEDVLKAADIVARDLDLAPDWLNTKAAKSGQSVPDGLAQRLHTRRYGKRLVVHFIDRFDQICLKLHAVVDRDASTRHLVDLRALNPSEQELIQAARWCCNQDGGDKFRDWVKSCLVKIGYGNAAGSIEY